MRAEILEFLACCVLAGCGVWWLAARIGPPPKPKPQVTPWHPERGKSEARVLLAVYTAVAVFGMVLASGVARHRGF